MTIFLDIHQKPIELPANEKVHWRVAAYPLVRSSDDKILLVTIQENSKFYILPGGEVELHESLIEGLQRECYEETGYKVEIIKRLQDVVYHHGETGEPIRVAMFWAKPIEKINGGEGYVEWVDAVKARELIWANGIPLLDEIWI